MIKLAKYLKPFILTILIVILLLFIQALCDLSLPDYMSDIVNVGIQQGGVPNGVPKVIGETELEKLLLFVKDNDMEYIKSNYTMIDKSNLSKEELDSYIEEYPKIESENIYELNTKDKDIIEELSNILSTPELIVMGIEEKEVPGLNVSVADPFDILEEITQEERDTITKMAKNKLKTIPDSMIEQMATNYVKGEYERLGIKVNELQNNYVVSTGVKMILISFISAASTVIVGLFASRIAAAVGRALRGDLFKKITSFSSVEYDKFSTASLITRTTNDVQQVTTLIVMGTRMILYAPILGIGGLIRVISMKSNMTWIIAVAVASIAFVVIALFTFAIPKFKKVQKLVDRLNLVTRETLTGLLVIRAFSTEKYEEKKFNKANEDLTSTNLFVSRIMTLMMPTMMFIMNAITLLIVFVGARKIDSGVLQVGDMMALIQYTMQIIMSFIMISMISVILPRASVSGNRISEVLESDIAIKEPVTPQKFKNSMKGIVEFKSVSFKYPGAEKNVLTNITFKAMPGKTTAFIGSTGSGKSTLINLIPRFYDVTEGEILLDGVNIRYVLQKDLRNKIGLVPQKGLLFSGTIESNIKYGVDKLGDKEILKASEIAQALEFITNKEKQFKTEISQGGSNVSGGQKQRLSIARALAKKPEVYIFDDSFSALDLKTDAALRKALSIEVKENTLLIVAQRISTILHADQIIVLDEGKIVGKGTHEELIENCDVYKQIAMSQLSKEELA